MSRQALDDYYVSEYTRNGIKEPNHWYAAIDRGWEVTSFPDGATARQPALFLTGEDDPSLKPLYGIDRQGPAFTSLEVNFPNLRETIIMPGVGHTPPEEKPDAINTIVLKFLSELCARRSPSQAAGHARSGSVGFPLQLVRTPPAAGPRRGSPPGDRYRFAPIGVS